MKVRVKVISTDSQFSMLAAKCEMVIMFAMFYPMLIPILGVAIQCNIIAFKWALSPRLQWSLQCGVFSFRLLFCSVLCEQVLLLCFLWSLFSSTLLLVLVVCFGLCDAVFVISSWFL